MFEFIEQYRNKLHLIIFDLPALGRYFHALALANAYVGMVDLFVQRATSHPEVARVPALLDIMLEHFQTYALEHINIETDQIFNRNFVGTLEHLEAWQDAGYEIDRDDDNYARRVQRFRAIWVGVPINGATYEQIIADRNEGYGDLVRSIPFWLPLNYGTGNVPGATNPGYPAVPGLHFVDIAEQRVQHGTARYLDLLTRFLAELLDIKNTSGILTFARSWVKSHTAYTDTHDIDIFAIAEKLARI